MSYAATGTTPSGTNAGTGTTSLAALPLPATRDGDLLLLAVWVKPDTATITTPNGWTDVSNGEAAGGGGTTGLDTGPTRLKVMYRVSPPYGTQAVSLASSPNCCMGVILSCRTDIANGGYDVAGANGIDTTTGTPFTAAMGSDPGITTGDLVIVFGGIPTDVTTPAQFSAPTITATGLTSGTVTEISEPETTQGNDLGGVIVRCIPSAGPASTVATFSTTAGGTTTNVRGPIVLVRVREVAAAAQMPVTPQQQLVAA